MSSTILPVGLTKLFVETQLTCGLSEALGRNQVVWFFTCGPNEALGRNQVVWSFTCGSNEAPGKNQVVWSSTCRPNKAPGRNHDNSIFVRSITSL